MVVGVRGQKRGCMKCNGWESGLSCSVGWSSCSLRPPYCSPARPRATFDSTTTGHKSNSHLCSWAPLPDARVTANTCSGFIPALTEHINIALSHPFVNKTYCIKCMTPTFGFTFAHCTQWNSITWVQFEPEITVGNMKRLNGDPDNHCKTETLASIWNKGFISREYPEASRRTIVLCIHDSESKSP